MSQCQTCPLSAGRRCPGQDARRLCDLANPSHPDHRPEYRESIPETARQLAETSHQYPSLAHQAANLAGALWSWAVSGFSVATDDLQESRRAVCRACPRYDAAAARCVLCGCHTDAKIAMKTEHCPEGRW